VVIGGAGTCDGGCPLGGSSGDPIDLEGAEQAAKVSVAFWESCEQWCFANLGEDWDAAPAKNLECVAGDCTADWASCVDPPDAGP
jgi:hypothetical protein